jgi:hypothetical protein
MDTRKAYADKMDAQLREWKAKYEMLKAKADKTGAEARIELQKKIDRLESELSELKRAGEGTWDSLKARVETAVKDIRDEWKEERVEP